MLRSLTILVILVLPKLVFGKTAVNTHAGYGPGNLVTSTGTRGITTIYSSTGLEMQLPLGKSHIISSGVSFNLARIQFQVAGMAYAGTYTSAGIFAAWHYEAFARAHIVAHLEPLLLPRMSIKTNTTGLVNDVVLKQSRYATYEDGQGILARFAIVATSKQLPVVYGLSIDILSQQFKREGIETTVNHADIGASGDASNTGSYSLLYVGLGLRAAISF